MGFTAHSLLTFIVSSERSAIIHTISPLHIMVVFPLIIDYDMNKYNHILIYRDRGEAAA